MVVFNRIYTRTGDDGTTSLGSGARRKKYDLRVEAYGTLDEVNAVIGLVRLHTGARHGARCRRWRASRTICSTSRPTSALPRKGPGGARLTVTDAQVAWLESEIDRLNAELEPLRSFILPGGSAGRRLPCILRAPSAAAPSASWSSSRTDRARASRRPSLKYVNRLSDYLFVAGRYANDKGRGDVLWAPGQNR